MRIKIVERELDELDRKILGELLINSNRSYRELARFLKMSPAAIIERIKNLESLGYITGYGCRLDYLKLGFEFMAVVEINISGKNLPEVEQKISEFPGVAAVWDTTGDYDAIAILMCKNRSQLSSLVKKIIGVSGVEKTNTNIVLNVVKRLTEFSEV
ncbi:Lrp/AsnC family transcriptional regulator [Candidatus Micrarchaeota archaeon]|nr:Lrp/AsnC family transcriptional regulator [Candidatus Micrarchaeota archaeon]